MQRLLERAGLFVLAVPLVVQAEFDPAQRSGDGDPTAGCQFRVDHSQPLAQRRLVRCAVQQIRIVVREQ